MNLYAELIGQTRRCIDYRWGYDPDEMIGLLQIDLEEKTYRIFVYPDGPRHMGRIESFANRILRECLSGNVKQKFSREIG